MRLFFALWPPPATAEALAAWAREVQADAGGRAIPAKSIHLTLAFLGEADADKAVLAAERVAGTAFELPIDTARYWKHNQIVWVGPVETPPLLLSLAEALHMELYRQEFILERRPFAAHVTLVRKARAPKSIPPLPTVPWPVRELALVRSRPSGKGSDYENLATFPLAAG